MPRPDLDLIRQRYAYACGYCGVSETSAGGILTIDHFRPLAAGGDDDLDNLVYACTRCNQYKHMPRRNVTSRRWKSVSVTDSPRPLS